MIDPRPVTLEGHGVRLEPLAASHLEGIEAAAADGKLWELWFTSVPEPGKTRAWLETALAGQEAKSMLPWAVRDLKSGAIVGSTRYHDIIAAADRVEIGWTWYGRDYQRSPVNTECKLLLLTHAFETLRLIRVEFKTDALNEKSRNALARIGAEQEGIFRKHLICDSGRIRDTVYFSMLDTEWPEKKRALEAMLIR
jgi:RimJ/RimL family protein N-acetyltransferase